jgi:hypothetical protein
MLNGLKIVCRNLGREFVNLHAPREPVNFKKQTSEAEMHHVLLQNLSCFFSTYARWVPAKRRMYSAFMLRSLFFLGNSKEIFLGKGPTFDKCSL